MSQTKKIQQVTQLSTLATNSDNLIADIQQIEAKKSIYSNEVLKQIQEKIQSKMKQQGDQENDFASHLQTVLKQTGRSLNDFSANFSYLKDIGDEKPQRDVSNSQREQNLFLIQDQSVLSISSSNQKKKQNKKKNKYLDLDQMNDDDDDDDEQKQQKKQQEDGDICLPGANIKKQLNISSEEMAQELKHHQTRGLKQNIVIKKFIQKGNIFNFKSQLFFQCTKVPKNGFFKRLFNKYEPRFIIINQEFVYVTELLPNSLTLGTIKSVTQFKRLFQIRKTTVKSKQYDVRFVFFNKSYNPFDMPFTKGPYRFNYQDWMNLVTTIRDLNIKFNKQYKVKIMQQ